MTAILLPQGKQQYFSNAGLPLVGGKLYTYDAGTSSPRLTWSDAAQAAPNTNPIILDARGEASIFWSGAYKVQLQDSLSNILWTQDNLNSLSGANSVLDNYAPDTGSVNALATTAAATITAYVAGLRVVVKAGNTNTGASTLNYQGLGVRTIVVDNRALVGGEMLAGGLYQMEYDGAQFQLLNAVFASELAAAAAFITAQTNITNIQKGRNDTDNMQQLYADLQAGTARSVGCFGDSTMNGNSTGGGAPVTFPPPSIIQNTVNTFFENSALTVTNGAIGGTSLSTMLAGTDGSGSTFAAKMASSTAAVIFCNHGLNDSYGANANSLATYRANLETFIRLCRSAPIYKTPVLVTSHPIVSTGSLAQQVSFAAAPAWSYISAQFFETMRQVAAQNGVILIDNYKWLSMQMGNDNTQAGVNVNAPLTVLPDGAHGTQNTYTQTGQNMVDAILGAGVDSLTTDMQVISASRGNAAAKTLSLAASSTSRYSAVFQDTNGTPRLKILFRIGAPGIDISLLQPQLTGLSVNIVVQLDGTLYSGLSQGTASWASGNYLQDYETQLFRQVNPGFHMLILTNGDGKPIAFNGIRARRNTRPIVTPAATAVAFTRELLFPQIIMLGANANEVAVFDSATLPFYIEQCQLEWTATLRKSSGVGVGGYYGNSSTAGVGQQTVMLGLNAAGFLTITEATGLGTYNSTVLDAVDHSGGSHIYAMEIQVGQIICFLDGAQVGGTTTLTQGYCGGNLCVWNLTAGTTLTINNVSRIWAN